MSSQLRLIGETVHFPRHRMVRFYGQASTNSPTSADNQLPLGQPHLQDHRGQLIYRLVAKGRRTKKIRKKGHQVPLASFQAGETKPFWVGLV